MTTLLRRLGAVAAIAAAALGLLPGTASAAGVNGIELAPDLPRVDGRYQVRVGEQREQISVELRNVVDEQRTVRLYAVPAEVSAAGAVSLGAGEDAGWVGLETDTVALAAGARQIVTASLDPTVLPTGDGPHHMAVVIESRQGDAVVARAATVIRVVGRHRVAAGLPLVVAAAGLVVAVGGLLGREVRHRGLVGGRIGAGRGAGGPEAVGRPAGPTLEGRARYAPGRT